MYLNWWNKYKSISKDTFLEVDKKSLQCAEIDKVINDNFSDAPKVISNVRDLYYLKSYVKYENVYYDSIMDDQNVDQARKIINNYKANGFTHLVYNSFKKSHHNEILKNLGCRNLGLEGRNYTVYEL